MVAGSRIGGGSGNGLVKEIDPGRIYATSILKVARQFRTVSVGARVRDLAEEFRRRPDLVVVAVVDASGRALGIVAAERLLALLSKPFGVDVLGKARVEEVMDDAMRWSASAELFTVAAEVLAGGSAGRSAWFLLEHPDGRHAGAFSARDLSDYLSAMTRLDVESAGALQERLMAGQEEARGPLWRVEAWSRMAKGIGGDLHFARRLSDTECFCGLCDVSGKGVEASVLVSMVWGMQRMHRRGDELGSFLRELNRAVVEAFHMEKYLTGFFLRFDRAASSLTMADMGHSHLAVFRDGRPWRLGSSGGNLPLGLVPDLEPSLVTRRLKRGDLVFAYTDGFIEQECEGGAEFGEARLLSAVSGCLQSGRPLAEGVRGAFDRFRGRVPQQDDASFLGLFVE